MLKLALHRDRVDISVLPPSYPALLHYISRLWTRRKGPRPGLQAPGSRTFVSLSFVEEKRAFVPFALSSKHRRLFCYTARFANGDVSLLIVAGQSMSRIFLDGVLSNALTALHLETGSRGPLTEHRVTEFLPDRQPVEALAGRLSLIAFKAFIMRPGFEPSEDLPPLNHTRLSLEGWSLSHTKAPTCTFKSSRDNLDVLVKIAWGRRSRESETVNVTTPLATLARAT